MDELSEQWRMDEEERACFTTYAYGDALGFCTEYLQDFEHTSRRIWDADEEDRDTKEVLEGSGRDVTFTDADLYNIHDYVIHNEECTAELLQ